MIKHFFIRKSIQTGCNTNGNQLLNSKIDFYQFWINLLLFAHFPPVIFLRILIFWACASVFSKWDGSSGMLLPNIALLLPVFNSAFKHSYWNRVPIRLNKRGLVWNEPKRKLMCTRAGVSSSKIQWAIASVHIRMLINYPGCLRITWIHRKSLRFWQNLLYMVNKRNTY